MRERRRSVRSARDLALLAGSSLLPACGLVTSSPVGDGHAPRDAGSPLDARSAARGDASRDAQPGDVGCDAGQPGVACVAQVDPAHSIWAVAVDDVNVYWSALGQGVGSDDVIVRKPRAGGAAVTIVTNVSLGGNLVSDGTNLYWANGRAAPGEGVERVAVTGGAVVTLARADAGLDPWLESSIAVDTSGVYFAQSAYDQGGIPGQTLQLLRVGKDGGAVSTVASESQVATLDVTASSLIAGDGRVYWLQGKYGQGVATGDDAAAPKVLFPQVDAGWVGGGRWFGGLALARGSLFFIWSPGAVLRDPFFGGGDGGFQIAGIPVEGGAAPTLFSSAPGVSFLAANESAVYSVRTGTAIEVDETPLDGGPARVLARPQAPRVNDLVLASDGTLYWTTDFQVQAMKP